MASRLGPRIDARAAFEATRSALLELLRGFGTPEWACPTAASPWTVRDIVAHLLGDDVARLSRSRDGLVTPLDADFPSALHRSNAEWVAALRPASPAVLIELLQTTSSALTGFWRSVDLDLAGEAVSWAGTGSAPVWLDCARDFSEDWIHQAQIREAAGRPALDRPDVRTLLIDTLLRAVPHTLDQHATAARALRIDIVDLERSWSWRRESRGWQWADDERSPDAVVGIDSERLWRVAVRMSDPEDTLRSASVSGDATLARAALHLVSIIR